MNNGQMNIASMPAARPLAAQSPAVPAAMTMDGVQQAGGNFAGVLNGIQSVAKLNASPDSGRSEEPMARTDEDQISHDAGSENPAAGLLALLQVSPQMVSVLEPAIALPQQEGHEEINVPTQGIASPVASAALSQSGRMPDVNIPSPLSAEWVRNGGPATEPTAVKTVPPEEKQAEQVAAEPEAPSEFQTAESDRMSDVNKQTPLRVDRLQNAATATGLSALLSVSAEKSQPGQTAAEPVQTPVTDSAKTAVVSAPPADPTSPVLDAAPESEIEIIISQSRPITARAITAADLGGSRSASPVQEIHGARQPVDPEQVIEKFRTGDEQNTAKEMASSPEMPASDSGAALGSGTSPGSGSNQGQPDVASGNQMFGQLKTDHQGGAALSAKADSAELSRQDIPEQVAQQVKERLVQHVVKPGNQQITLTLSPDTLGELKMNLNLQGQKLSVEIVAENRAVRDAILQHTDALKESLARQNITMESFDVTTGGKGSGNQGQNHNAWRELERQQQQQQFWTSTRGYHTAQADPLPAQVYQRQQGQAMLDIHY